MSSRMINNSDITDTVIPQPPNIGYYDLDKSGTDNSAGTIKSLLQTNCGGIGQKDNADFLYGDKDKIYKDTITGSINSSCKTGTSVNANPDTIEIHVKESCKNDDSKITNQLKYLSCQLATARSRLYQSTKFDIANAALSVKDVFDKFANLKPFMIMIFILSMYFLVQGFFSSFDVASNVVNVIENNSSRSIWYYIALLAGVAVPVIILCLMFVRSVCQSLESVEKYNITENPEGTKETIASGFKKVDYSVLFLFIILVYGFVFVLFSVKRESVGNIIYLCLIGGILFIISIFLYLFYAFIPFFATANTNNIGDNKEIPLKLYIDQQQEPAKITTNQDQVQHLQKVFGITSVVIFVFFCIYMIGSKKMQSITGKWKDLFNGLFGASAVLIIPILWVFNFILATKYFYIYPIILLGFRFLRYIGMGILFTQYNSAKKYGIEGLMSGDGFSDDLRDELDHFADYSPSYNLVGMDIVKTLLNIFGYDNIFSQKFKNNNKFDNLSANRYVIPGLFSYIFRSNSNQENPNGQSRFMIQCFIGIITIIISSILLWGIYKV